MEMMETHAPITVKMIEMIIIKITAASLRTRVFIGLPSILANATKGLFRQSHIQGLERFFEPRLTRTQAVDKVLDHQIDSLIR